MQEVVMRTMTCREGEGLVEAAGREDGIVHAYIVRVLELGKWNLFDGNLERTYNLVRRGTWRMTSFLPS